MNKMAYFEPNTLAEASTLLNELHGVTAVIAGGTDVVVRYNKGVAYDNMINIKRIDGLKGISVKENGIEIGALTTHSEIADNVDVMEKFPALAKASNNVGSRLIRNMGTIGGNICNASPVADTVCPLIVLNAVFKLEGTNGEVEIPAGEFFVGPGKTLRQNDEILKSVFIPFTQDKQYQGFNKLGPRKNADIALVNTAVAFVVSDGVISEAKIAFGSVGPKVMRIPSAEALLKGKKPSEVNLDAVAEACEASVTPITDVRSSKEYRRRGAYYLIKDTLYEIIMGI